MPPPAAVVPRPQVLVGSYTTGQGGRARGVSLLKPGEAGLDPVEAETLELPSPSYLACHPRGQWFFAVSETAPAMVSSVRVGQDGSLVLLSSRATGGDDACHLAVAPDGRHLLVAHYGSGSVASFAVGPDGQLSERVDLGTFRGSGPDRDRQRGSHAHQVVWDGDEVLVADLGSDRLHRLQLSRDGRLHEAAPAVSLPPGSGPRHLVVLGDHLVVACELSGRLWLAGRDSGGDWNELDSVPCSADAGPALPSALRADADLLFVANRGPATVSVVALDARAGRLRRTAEFSSGGSGPRDLVLTATQLWVANQHDDVLSVFDRSRLPPSFPPVQVSSPTPACLALWPPAGR